MKLTNYIVDVGRPVAYYPQLKRITGSTTSAILLCQLLYWCDKTKNGDGWIYKTSDEIEEETGLTYYEQITARKMLVEKGLIEEKYRRLRHRLGFWINHDQVNGLWESEIGYGQGTVKKDELVEVEAPTAVEPKTEEKPVEKAVENVKPQEPVRRTDATVKGDLMDGHLAYLTPSANQKVNALFAIKDKIEKRFHLIADDKRWEKFINFVYTQETKNNQPFDKFIDWALENGFEPQYWTPEKMKTLYPQAFIAPTTGVYRDDFVDEPKMDRKKEKEIVPMPKEMTRKKNLY